MIRQKAADDLADEAGAKNDECGSANGRETEMASLCEVVGSPGNEAIKYEIEPQPAEQHAPEGTKSKKAEEIGTARRRRRERLVLFRMLGFEVERLGLIRRRLLPALVTYAPIGDQPRAPAGWQRRQCLKGTPQDRCGGNNQSRPVAVGKPASWDLHERIGPEERTEDNALRRRVDPELPTDRWHGDRQGSSVDIVDGDDQQNEQEYTPSDRGFSGEIKRRCHRCATLGKYGHPSETIILGSA